MLEELKKLGGIEVEENIPLKNLTTMRVGGNARYFVVAHDMHELLSIAKAVLKLNLNFFILAGGSNIIISDNGFDGVVIKNESGDVSLEGNEAMVDSGIALGVLIRKLAELDLGGLEFLAGIPGTIGGALVSNAGAFGDNISNHLKSVTILDPMGEVRIVLKDDLKFGYRESYFSKIKDFKERGIILRARLILRRGRREEISRKINNYLRLRSSQPKGFSCGSFFKNPKIKIIEKDWETVVKDGRIPAGYLLEQVGAKGKNEGKICVSNDHANWLINRGKGSAEEIKALAESLKTEVDRRFGIKLEEEVNYIGLN